MKNSRFIFLFLVFTFALNNCIAQKKGNPKEKSGVTAKYDMAGPFCNGIARVKLNHKWGFIDTTGNVIIAPKYNEVSNFSDGLAKVRLGQKWGLVDTKGTIIIKPTFDAIMDFVDGKAKVLIEGEEYYMNREGQRVSK